MDLMLNAVEDDGSGGEGSPPPPPPAFAMPVGRISAPGGASLSSILSAASPQTPHDAPPPFELPVARRAGLAGLMNSPRDGSVHEPDDHRSPVEPVQRHVDRDEARPPRDEDDDDEGDEMEDDPMENDESPVKRRRGYSIASEASVSTPPPAMAATSVQSPASVALHADALVLEDAELVELKTALQLALQKYISAEARANAPPAKRRKGKQQQKKRGAQVAAQAEASTAVSESVEAVEQCMARVHEKITVDLMEINVLRDVARMCVTFLSIVNGTDPVGNSTPTDMKVALEILQQKAVHVQLASAIRRVLISVPEDAVPLVLGDVFECIFTGDTDTALWGWLFVFFAQFDSSAVVNFLVHRAVLQPSTTHGDQELDLILRVLECFAANRCAELVEAVTKTLQYIATSTDSVGASVTSSLTRLVSIGYRSPVILRSLDDSFQWVLTPELVLSLWKRFAEGNKTPVNGADKEENASMTSKLLQLLDVRTPELDNSLFQGLVLLQQLAAMDDTTPSNDLAQAAREFHADVIRIAERQKDSAILNRIYRRTSYIAQVCVELLAELRESSKTRAVETRLESWKSWLVVIATAISRREVADQLIQADLMACEIATSSEASPVPVNLITELLCSIVQPSSPDFIALLREIAERLRQLVLSSSGRFRLLSILEHLVDQSTNHHASDLKLTPLRIRDGTGHDDIDIIIDAFSQMSSSEESWNQLERWRAASGAELWEYLVDLIVATDQNSTELSTHALHLLAKTPFPSLEEPLWQFRSIRKLTNIYFHALRRYRASSIDLDSSQGTRRRLRKQLQTTQSLIARICASDGAVAHYPASVFSQFASLWLDSLFSTASATSVPTHFPSSTKGDSLATKKATNASNDRRDVVIGADDQVVIRSERTISSKCTNLQSSQVITKHSETLVYRKALDETWERELHAAFSCSVFATNLVGQLVRVQAPDIDVDKSERRMKVLVDMLLERASPCCGAPSDDVYKEFLPNRSSFDVDLRIEQWLNHFPAFLPLLRLVVDHCVALPTSTQSLRLVAIIKSALVVLVGHWNSVKGELDVENMDVPPYMRNRNQVALSCELLRILRASGWLPEPLARTAELLPLTTPADIRGILFSCWFFLADHPPSSTTAQVPSSSNAPPAKMPTEFYLLPVRKALHRNIHKVGAKYSSFMC